MKEYDYIFDKSIKFFINITEDVKLVEKCRALEKLAAKDIWKQELKAL